jgi:hypothetical protein
MPFDLQATITAALSTGKPLTFDHIVARVAESLTPGIRLTLNELVAKGQIKRRVGGRNYPWCCQASPVKDGNQPQPQASGHAHSELA